MKEIFKIENLDHFGRGIARYNNMPIFISNALIGEEVEASFTMSKKYGVGKTVNILNRSKERVNPICKYYDICGGCDLQHMDYNEQLRFKENKIKELINKFLKLDIKVNSIVSSSKIWNYRNKITLHNNSYYKKNSKELIKIDECKLVKKEINDYLVKNKTNVVKCFNNKICVDEGYTNLGNYKFRISKDSFFQVNDEMTLKLYDKIKSYCKKSDNVLDLYCGVGSIGIYISDCVNSVLGIEINKNSIKDAIYNKEINNIKNIDFICSDVSKNINKINSNLVIVDPPRAGLEGNSIKDILNIDPETIIYVSCDPATLMRDLKILSEYYEIIEITPFDMFPQTYHVETISLLKKI